MSLAATFVTPGLTRGLPAFSTHQEGGSRVKPGMTGFMR